MTEDSDTGQQLAKLQQKLDAMPPVASMEIRAASFAGGQLRLTAPLSRNVNDKGSAFGGSLAGLMTLACWGSASLALERAGFVGSEVYVQDSQVKYLTPLYDDLQASGQLQDGFNWDDFVRAFRERGKARVSLCAEVRCPDGRVAASFEGRFVALRPA